MSNYSQFPDALEQERRSSRIVFWFIVGCCLFFFYQSISSPRQNWDLVGYAAATVSLENSDPLYVHGYVYGELKKYLTDEQFDKFNRPVYPNGMLHDADAFNQQIPYYKIRIIFIGLMFLLVKMGLNIFLAGHIITAFSASAGLLLFYFAYKRVIHPAFWILTPLFFYAFQISYVAQIVSADSLAFFWVGLLCFTFMHNYLRAFFILLALSVAVRTDLIILVALFSSYFLLLRPETRTCTVICTIIAAGLYVAINKLAGNYGWSTVFYFQLIDPEALYPVEYSSKGISVSQYISVVKSQLWKLFYDPLVLLFQFNAFMQLIIFWLCQPKIMPTWSILISVLKNPALILTLLSGGYLLAHFLLFPVVWHRFFVAQYLAAAMGLLVIITNLVARVQSESNKIAIAD